MCTAIVLVPTVFAKALHPDSPYPDVATPSRGIDCGSVSGHAGEVRGLTARESCTCGKTRSLQHIGKRKQRTRIETCGPFVPLQIKHRGKEKILCPDIEIIFSAIDLRHALFSFFGLDLVGASEQESWASWTVPIRN